MGSNGAGVFVGSINGQTVSIFGTDVINNNASGVGGGLYYTENPSDAGNTLIVDTSTFDNNSADAAGGIFAENTDVTIDNSTISNNTATGGVSSGGGGVLFQDFVGPTVTSYAITNSTISGNTTSGNGGGVYGNLNPGGGVLTISSSTITDNASTTTNTNVGDGVHDSLGAITVQDTIIADNGDRNCTALGVSDGGNNISTDTTCGFAGTGIGDGVDPLLNGLADNGGFTETHSLQAGSPALDNGSGGCPADDQRDTGRDANCDIGAYEGITEPLAEISLSVDETTIYEDGTVTVATVTVFVDNTASGSSANLTIPLTVTGSASGISIDYTMSNQNGIGSGSDGFVDDITTTVAAGGTFTDTFTVTVVDDSFVEGDELATIVADVVGYGTIVSDDTVSITIISDDVNPVTPTTNTTSDDDDDEGSGGGIAIFDPAISKLGFLSSGAIGLEGETIQWSITVSNPGGVTGNNVVVTDTLRSELRINNVNVPTGVSASTSGQTVTVTIPTLNPGDSVQFSISTTVISGGLTIDNTACVTASNIAQVECATASAISQLPNTGETPRNASVMWLLLLSLCGLCTAGIYARIRMTYSAPSA